MAESPISLRTETALNAVSPLLQFFTQSRWSQRFGSPGICDFTIGNPHEMPSAAFVETLGELELIPMDLERLQKKRDRLVSALREMGYSMAAPEGTFYCLVRSPLSDDRAFIEMLAELNVFCIPGSLQGAAGYFRISLTASEEMIEKALPLFAQVMQQAKMDVSDR